MRFFLWARRSINAATQCNGKKIKLKITKNIIKEEESYKDKDTDVNDNVPTKHQIIILQ